MNQSALNFLIALKNASIQKKETVVLKQTKLNSEIIFHLYIQGYVQSYKILNMNKIFVTLRYFFNKPLLNKLTVLFKYFKSRFLRLKDLIKLSPKKFTLFLSTNKGLLTLEECKKMRIGGKPLFYC